MTDSGSMQIEVEVVYALAERYWSVRLRLPEAADVGQALALAGSGWVPEAFRSDIENPAAMAVFGRTATLRTRLHDGDRIELLRPLMADPKTARRKRASDAKRVRR